MTTWYAEWSSDHPVRWSPGAGYDPDRWITLDDAADRLARDYPDEVRMAERARIRTDLQLGRILSTGWATYRLEYRP